MVGNDGKRYQGDKFEGERDGEESRKRILDVFVEIELAIAEEIEQLWTFLVVL